MFQPGDYVIYGNYGVCRIEGAGPIEMDGVKKDRLYYTLKPVYAKGNIIYTPVDNDKVIIRPLISQEEAKGLIDHIQEIDALWVSDERKREERYKNALRTCDCRELVGIIKSLYLRKKTRSEDGKKVTASDAKYLHLAEENLYGELAFSLNIGKDQVEDYIVSKVG